MKKTLVYYRGRAPHGLRTNWVMHEYRLTYPTSSPSIQVILVFFSSARAIYSSYNITSSDNANVKQESYALCRVFKKNIQIPKRKEEEMSTSVGKEEEEEEKKWKKYDGERMERESEEVESLKIASAETSSSELTQGILLDEANSSSIFALHFSSSFLDDHDTFCENYPQLPSHPPLQLQDFPQLSMNEAEIISMDNSKQQDFHYRDSVKGTLDEIFSFASSSATLPPSL